MVAEGACRACVAFPDQTLSLFDTRLCASPLRRIV